MEKFVQVLEQETLEEMISAYLENKRPGYSIDEIIFESEHDPVEHVPKLFCRVLFIKDDAPEEELASFVQYSRKSPEVTVPDNIYEELMNSKQLEENANIVKRISEEITKKYSEGSDSYGKTL